MGPRGRLDAVRAVAPALATGLLGVSIVAVAVVFDSASLYVPGVALLVLGLASAVWVTLAARGATLARTLGPATVVEGERYPIRIEMHAGALPPPGGELSEPLLADSLAVAGRRSRRVRVNVTFDRRGRHALAACRLLIRDPLWLARRELASQPGDVLVLPRIEPVRVGTGGLGAESGGVGRQGVAAELEIDSLRPYREGTPAARIHWPTVARTGTMVERRLVAEADSRPLVVLDARGAAGEEDLDAAVRAAGSICSELARKGGCGLLLPGQRRPVEVAADMRAWPALHVRLALVAPGDGAPALGRLERAGAIFWVSAARGGGTPAALRRAGAGVRYLVCPGRTSGRAAFAVTGCVGRRLGAGRPRVAA